MVKGCFLVVTRREGQVAGTNRRVINNAVHLSAVRPPRRSTSLLHFHDVVRELDRKLIYTRLHLQFYNRIHKLWLMYA